MSHCECWRQRWMSALEQYGQWFTKDCVIGKCLRFEFWSNFLANKWNWIWGLDLNVCFDIMKTPLFRSVSRKHAVHHMFQHPKSTIYWIPQAQRNNYLECVLGTTPKDMQIHQEKKKQSLLMKVRFCFRITHSRRAQIDTSETCQV